MKNYNLIANNAQGASVEFNGTSMADCKKQFSARYELKEFTARIYDAENGAFCQLKPMGKKTYQNPS